MEQHIINQVEAGASEMKNLKEVTIYVRDAMSKNVTWVSEDDSVLLVMQIFERTSISGAPVVGKEGHHIGVVTKTDLSGGKIIRLIREKRDLDATSITAVMSPQVKTIDENSTLEAAVKLMLEHQYHRLFVVNNSSKITGVLSTLDALNALMYGTPAAQAAVPAGPDIHGTARKLLRESQSGGRM